MYMYIKNVVKIGDNDNYTQLSKRKGELSYFVLKIWQLPGNSHIWWAIDILNLLNLTSVHFNIFVLTYFYSTSYYIVSAM